MLSFKVMFFSMHSLLSLIITYKYAILLPIAIIEGPIITIIGGFLASMGILNIFIIYLIAIAGDVIGDIIYYFIGRLGSHSILPKFGHRFGLTPDRIEYAKEHYRKHFLKTILIGKITEAPVVPIIIVMGIAKFNFKKFFFTIVLITIVKAAAFSSIGFFFGKSYILIGKYLDNYLFAMFILFVVLIIGYFLLKSIRKETIKI